MTKQAAMLYARLGRAFVTPESQTVDGFWIASGPCLVEDLGDVDRLARLTLEALAQSRLGVPTPPPSAAPDSELLQRAGVDSFGTFMRGTRAVRIEASGGVITATPMRNGGARRGFEFKEAEAVTVREREGLPAALVAALQAAE